MRIDLRLYGHTKNGKKCQALLSVYAGYDNLDKESQEVKVAAETACWLGDAPDYADFSDKKIFLDKVERISPNMRASEMEVPDFLKGLLSGDPSKGGL